MIIDLIYIDIIIIECWFDGIAFESPHTLSGVRVKLSRHKYMMFVMGIEIFLHAGFLVGIYQTRKLYSDIEICTGTINI